MRCCAATNYVILQYFHLQPFTFRIRFIHLLYCEHVSYFFSNSTEYDSNVALFQLCFFFSISWHAFFFSFFQRVISFLFKSLCIQVFHRPIHTPFCVVTSRAKPSQIEINKWDYKFYALHCAYSIRCVRQKRILAKILLPIWILFFSSVFSAFHFSVSLLIWCVWSLACSPFLFATWNELLLLVIRAQIILLRVVVDDFSRLQRLNGLLCCESLKHLQ